MGKASRFGESKTSIVLIAFVFVFLSGGLFLSFDPFSTQASPTDIDYSDTDDDRDGIDDGLEEHLLNKYAPVVLLYPDDEARPANVDWFLARSLLKFHHNNASDCPDPSDKWGQPTQDLIVQKEHRKKCWEWLPPSWHHCGDYQRSWADFDEDQCFYLDLETSAYPGASNPNDWIVYGHVYPNTSNGINIQYWFFYPFNDNRVTINHEGDWEHILVELGSDLSVSGVGYYHHFDDVQWEEWENDSDVMRYDSTHPVVISAMGSHASYPDCTACRVARPGLVAERHCCKATTVESSNHAWFTWKGGKPAGKTGFQGGGIVNVGESGAGRYVMNDQWFVMYSGRWGQIGSISKYVFWGDPVTSGPRGPAYQDTWWEGMGPANQPPDRPTSMVPRWFKGFIDVDVDLEWECQDPNGDPLTYDVYFGPSADPPKVKTAHPHTTYDPGTLEGGTKYYWRIVCRDKYGLTSPAGASWFYTSAASGDLFPGTVVRTVTPITPTPVPPSSKIAFDSERDGNREIYVMDADGSNPTRLTDNTATDRDPAWSPDGSKIAFDSDREAQGDREIYVMDADGSNQTNLTNDPANDGAPDWSPDGAQIVFHSNRDGNFEIYVMDADGTNPTNLTDDQAGDFYPAWSPDGSKIAFYSNRDGNREIYVMDADGTNPTNLTNDQADDRYPAWSPDGSKIAFRSDRDGDSEIYVMDADGGNPSNLTNDPANDGAPAWSPDGSQLAFRSNRDGNDEIYVMEADGTNPTNLTNDPADDRFPDWHLIPATWAPAAPPATATPAPPPATTAPAPFGWLAATIPATSWANFTSIVDSSPQDMADCFGEGNFAAMYRLDSDSGLFQRWFPGREDVSNMEDVAQYDALLVLNASDQPATCEMPAADLLDTDRTLDWGVGWHNEGWTGADVTDPEDAFACADGSYVAAYHLADGAWQRHFPGRPDISNMEPLDTYDTFLILVTAPVSCTMSIAP